jgi:hypothetical protein
MLLVFGLGSHFVLHLGSHFVLHTVRRAHMRNPAVENWHLFLTLKNQQRHKLWNTQQNTLPHSTPSSNIHTKKHILTIFITSNRTSRDMVTHWQAKQTDSSCSQECHNTNFLTPKRSCAGSEGHTQGGSQTCCAHNWNDDSQTVRSHGYW